jgi:hypothetical protein
MSIATTWMYPFSSRSCTVEPVDILLLLALGRLEGLLRRLLVSFLWAFRSIAIAELSDAI